MDRKGLITIVVTIAIVACWHIFVSQPKQAEAIRKYKEDIAKYEAAEALKKEAASSATAPLPAQPGAPAGQPAVEAPAPVRPAVPEEKRIVSSEVGTVDYEFTNFGGGISRVVLKEHLVDKSKNAPVTINEFGTFAIGAMAEQPGDEAGVKLPWTMTADAAAGVVTFERTDTQRQIKITKKFSTPRKPDESDKRRVKLRSEYLVALEVTHTNTGTGPMMVPKSYMHLGGAAPINENEVRYYQGFDYYRDGETNFKDVDWFGAGGFLFWKHDARPFFRDDRDLVRWGAVTNQYFTTLITVLGADGRPEDEQRALLGNTTWAKRTDISADQWRLAGHSLTKNIAFHQVEGAIGLPEFALTPGQSITRNYQIYAGPRELRRLRLLDHHESEVLNYGSFLGIPTGWVSEILLNSMNGLFFLVGSYALAIIILTIIVKAILWPLQSKANKNMKRMGELQPQIKALQDKYKGDPARFQKEMAAVWKKAGVNPLSGCWPIFIQIPIFIGFYNMLGKAVELRHHGFLWVQDLAAPDTIAHIFGLPINPLPLLMAGTMLLQMKMSPQAGDPMQRRIFMLMPLIFIFICYDFASALALYWTVQNIISIVQLMINRGKNVPAPQPAAAT